MTNRIRDQRGVAMILEVLLLVAVLAAVGVVVWRSYHRSTSLNPVATPTATASVTPNGSVVNAVNSVTQNTASESTISSKEDDSTVTTGADTAAQNIGGSYNENSF